MDVVTLSRIQFALTIMFHYIFPPLTIGLGIVLVYLDGMAWRTGKPIYRSAAHFWTRIFALHFAIGVATGIVMEFEFGTNWATYSRFVGDVFGSALAAEGIFAFFLESGFLAVLVFGWKRVSPGMHFFSTCMVALGSIFSSFWIVIANSWQQTPAGHRIVPLMRDGEPWIVDGEVLHRAEIHDFWAMVFNPSTAHRLSHTLVGCFLMGAFFVMSISAWYLLRGRHLDFARHSFRGALVLSTVASLAALAGGHLQAKTVAHTQPAKLAAFEAHFESGRADLTLFGIPDARTETVRGAVAIPGGLGFLVHEDFDAEIPGLDRFRPEDRPGVIVPFFSYRVMVGLGLFFIALNLAGCIQWARGKLWTSRRLLRVFVFAVVGALVANQAGWIAAETGRQPWIVHPPVERDATGALALDADGFVAYDETQGLRTTEGVSKAVRAEQVLGSLILFSLIYLLLGAVWLFLLDRKIRQGPDPVPGEDAGAEGGGGFLRSAARGGSLTEEEAAP